MATKFDGSTPCGTGMELGGGLEWAPGVDSANCLRKAGHTGDHEWDPHPAGVLDSACPYCCVDDTNATHVTDCSLDGQVAPYTYPGE